MIEEDQTIAIRWIMSGTSRRLTPTRSHKKEVCYTVHDFLLF